MGVLYLITGVVGYAALGAGMDVHRRATARAQRVVVGASRVAVAGWAALPRPLVPQLALCSLVHPFARLSLGSINLSPPAHPPRLHFIPSPSASPARASPRHGRWNGASRMTPVPTP